MDKAFNGGGAAFPRTGVGNAGHSYDVPAQDGMSLRDYFAAKAMQGFLANREFCAFKNRGAELAAETLASNSYEVADAMLAERAKAKGGA